jgi:phosphonate transport system substrate-binding protein
VMQQRLLPLISYLSNALGRPVVLRLSTDMPGAINALVSNDVDLAYLTPVAYVNAHARSKVQLAVKTVSDGRPSFKLMIVVGEGSPIRKVEDLAGKRFAFGDPAALLQRAVVVGAGMPLQRLGEYAFVDHYDNVVRGVMVGDYDAGIVIDSTASRWQGKGIRVLYASQDLPPYNIAASANLEPATVARLREALVRLDPANPAHKSVIAALGESYTGFAAADDADYDVIRKLIAPFKK